MNTRYEAQNRFLQRSLAVIAFVGLFLSGVVAAAPALQTNEVTRFDGTTVQYHITRDATIPRQPLLLILQGSDCNSARQNSVIDEYARAAPKSAVLSIEKYGITDELPWSSQEPRADCPNDYLRFSTLEQRILDCMLVLEQLRRSAKWWNRELVLIGGSSGALVASSVATFSPEVTRLVIFGFGSRKFTDDLSYGIESSMRAQSASEEAIAKELQTVLSLFEEMARVDTTSEFVSGHSFAYWASMQRVDQYALLANVDVPVLALQGSEDQSASAKGAQALVAQLHAAGRQNIEYREYPGLDHGFRNVAGVRKHAQVINEIASWLGSPVEKPD